MSFILSDLNDYISPSQACIIPPKVQKVENPHHLGLVSKDDEQELQQASITLQDCLACSGCITSAETVLVAQQSLELLMNVFNQVSALKLNVDALANELSNESSNIKDIKWIVFSISEQSRASLAAKYSYSPDSIYKKLKTFLKSYYSVDMLVDASFARDLSLYESLVEFLQRIKHGKQLPMLASQCPGWICYAEKTHGTLLPYISNVKSPQQIMGSLVKHWLPKTMHSTDTNVSDHVMPENIYHVSIMPCYDKKLEASRAEFTSDNGTRDVDLVLTTMELDEWVSKHTAWDALAESELSPLLTKFKDACLLGTDGSSSGGYLSYILRSSAKILYGLDISSEDLELGRNGIERIQRQTRGKNVDFTEIRLRHPQSQEILLNFAYAYGFKNIQNVVRKIKSQKAEYQYVEIMACPSGCINGGGQLKSDKLQAKEWISLSENAYKGIKNVESPEMNESAMSIYASIQEEKTKYLYTTYKAVENNIANTLGVKW